MSSVLFCLILFQKIEKGKILSDSDLTLQNLLLSFAALKCKCQQWERLPLMAILTVTPVMLRLNVLKVNAQKKVKLKLSERVRMKR